MAAPSEPQPPSETAESQTGSHSGHTVMRAGEATAPHPPPDGSMPAGTRIGPYEILGPIGTGGMGTVYQARHLVLNKIVALKFLHTSRGSHPEAVARFLREMKAIGALQHPNIVQAFDAGEAEGTHFLAMEYVPGISIHAQLAQCGPLTIEAACAVVRQAASALGAAHAIGLIHRDVKPSNLLLTPSGTVKLLDLGIARWMEEESDASDPLLTQEDDQIGTPDFMAPEQWDDPRLVDARTDLYGLGCTLHALLTGKAPYASDTVRSRTGKRKAHVDGPIPDLRALRPDAPDELVRIHRRLLEKKPEDRFASAAELIEALRELAGGTFPLEPTPADPTRVDSASTDRRSRPSKPAPHWLASTRARLGLEFAVLAIVVGVLAWATPSSGPAQKPSSDGLSATNSLPSPELTLTPDEIARWVVQVGGTLIVTDGSRERPVRRESDLPVRHAEIAELRLQSCKNFFDADLNRFSNLPALRRINLNFNPQVTDAALTALGPLPALEHLEMFGSQVTDKSWPMLLAQPRLRFLDLWRCRHIRGEGSAGISALPIEVLKLGSTGVTDAAVLQWGEFPTLRELALTGCPVTIKTVRHLTKIAPQLQSLTLDGTKAESAEAIALLTQFPELREFKLNGWAYDGVQGTLLKLPHLEKLGIGYNAPRLSKMSDCPTLRTVEWLWIEPGEPGIPERLDWSLPQVERIRFESMDLPDQYGLLAETCPHAEIVEFHECIDFTDHDAEVLAGLPYLSRLRLGPGTDSVRARVPLMLLHRPELVVELIER